MLKVELILPGPGLRGGLFSGKCRRINEKGLQRWDFVEGRV